MQDMFSLVDGKVTVAENVLYGSLPAVLVCIELGHVNMLVTC